VTKGRLEAFSDGVIAILITIMVLELSIVAYLVAIPIAFVAPYGSVAIYVAVATGWFVPDRRMERAIGR
jgi:uncharacterized membrane protein